LARDSSTILRVPRLTIGFALSTSINQIINQSENPPPNTQTL